MSSNTQTSQGLILTDIKTLLGLGFESESAFDTDILLHINSVFSNLHSMGIGPDGGFTVSATSKWDEFFTNDEVRIKTLANIKSYVYIKVRLLFDPPANSKISDSLFNAAKEFEYRLYTAYGGY